MKRQKIAIIVAAIIITIAFGIFMLMRKDTPLTEQAAVEAVKQKYPALQDYPSDKLPPRSISAEQSDGKWYIAFVEHGSGRPILEARCFIVDSHLSIVQNGTFVPKPDNTAQNISPATCNTTQ